eukprot:TRINITY_DN1638_c0_g1_i1.p2 TRINITY_DN1638_c0_g1~~TRINITY_DN1638_c0_g1_i1.p2  ORF type:complete len:148 (+),score=54.37 TRINITY_DN1638_c0_g1_i1:121-564(+)
MVKFIKYGRIVILLNGRYAGRKAVVIRNWDDGTKERKFGHALVVGINRYPRRVTKRTSKKRFEKKTKLTPFAKIVNYNHIMPTRYQIGAEWDLKNVINEENIGKERKGDTLKEVKKFLQEKYLNLPTAKGPNDKASHIRFFFKKLRF